METLSLQDIHLPAPAGFWPLALGWWVLFALCILIISGLIYKVLQHKKRKKIRTAIYAQFDALEKKLVNNPSNANVAAINTLLRQLAMQYYPRTKIASLAGNKWLQFLDESGDTQGFSRGAGRILIEAPYRLEKQINNLNTHEFITLIKNWAYHVIYKHS